MKVSAPRLASSSRLHVASRPLLARRIVISRGALNGNGSGTGADSSPEESAPSDAPIKVTASSSSDRQASSSGPSSSGAPTTFGGKTLDELSVILSEDLSHLFDEKGVDPNLYASKVEFRDPITKYDSVQGYLFNIKFLKNFFRPEFYLHDMRKTGPRELTSRWAMVMYFPSLIKQLWAPVLKFTGESVYEFDDQGKCTKHLDTWDSIRGSQAYFSREGLADLLAQLATFASPPASKRTPAHRLLRRRREYEVREYPAFPIVRYASPNPQGEREGTRAVKALYRATSAASPTAPLLQWEGSKVALPVVPQEAGLGEASARRLQGEGWPVEAARFERGLYAVASFSGFANADVVSRNLRTLRQSLKADGLGDHTSGRWYLATYHGDDEFKSFKRLNEIWVQLDDNSFTLWPRDTPGRG